MPVFKSLNDSKLIKLIQNGSVGVLPTDTVYGLVASATDQTATARLYNVKHRETKPGTVVAASIDQLVELGIPRRYLKAVEQFWPGAVSVIVPTETRLGYLHLGKFSLACRVTDNKELQALLDQVGPLITTSANQPGKPLAENLKSAKNYFGDQVDFYVDGGDLAGHQPSTIIRVVDDAVEVVRQGSVIV